MHSCKHLQKLPEEMGKSIDYVDMKIQKWEYENALSEMISPHCARYSYQQHKKKVPRTKHSPGRHCKPCTVHCNVLCFFANFSDAMTYYVIDFCYCNCNCFNQDFCKSRKLLHCAEKLSLSTISYLEKKYSFCTKAYFDTY